MNNWKTIILAGILAGLQCFILYTMNGELAVIIAQKDLAVLGLTFAPTAGIVWALKASAGASKTPKDKDNE